VRIQRQSVSLNKESLDFNLYFGRKRLCEQTVLFMSSLPVALNLHVISLSDPSPLRSDISSKKGLRFPLCETTAKLSPILSLVGPTSETSGLNLSVAQEQGPSKPRLLVLLEPRRKQEVVRQKPNYKNYKVYESPDSNKPWEKPRVVPSLIPVTSTTSTPWKTELRHSGRCC